MSLTPANRLDDPPFHSLIYGPPGVGKSRLAAEIACHLVGPTGTVGYLDYENSSDTLVGTDFVNQITVYKDIKELIRWREVVKAIKDTSHNAWIVDSASSMSHRLLSEIMKKSRNDKPKFDEWNELTFQMREIFYACIDSDNHLIMVSHQREAIDEDTDTVKEIRPALTPAARAAAEQVFSEALYLTLKIKPNGSERVLTVESQGKIFAKNRRSAWTENKYTNPNVKEMFNA